MVTDEKIDRRWGFGKKEVSLGMILFVGLGLFLLAQLLGATGGQGSICQLCLILSPLLTAVNRADFY